MAEGDEIFCERAVGVPKSIRKNLMIYELMKDCDLIMKIMGIREMVGYLYSNGVEGLI